MISCYKCATKKLLKKREEETFDTVYRGALKNNLYCSDRCVDFRIIKYIFFKDTQTHMYMRKRKLNEIFTLENADDDINRDAHDSLRFFRGERMTFVGRNKMSDNEGSQRNPRAVYI